MSDRPGWGEGAASDEGVPEAVDARWVEALLDRLSIGAFRIDQATQSIASANEAYARLVGFPSASAAIGSSVLALYEDPKERQEIATRISSDELFRTTGVARLEVRRLRHDTREPVDVMMTVTTRADETGRVIGVDGVFQAARPPDALLQAFRASEARFRAVFEASGVGLAIADLSGRLYRVNAVFAAFLGRPESELLGGVLASHLAPDDADPLVPPPNLTVGRASGGERRFRRPDGSVVVGELTWSTLVDESGAPHSLVVALLDVTERRRLEDGLARMARLESLGVLAGGIAHDFNNILAVILGNVTLAARQPGLSGEGRALLASAEDALGRARDLARQLVTFAKGGVPRKRVGSLAEVARATAGFCLRGSPVAVDLELPPSLWAAEFDEAQIGQVVQNILLNAVQAMPRGGRVRLEGRNVELGAVGDVPLPSGRYVLLRVTDEGEGIDPAHLPRIFDPYFSTKSAGSGLGLATAHSIVTRHGGYLGVASELGRGATFSVYLPACSDARPEPAPVRSPVEPAHVGPARVLVMDDERNLLRLVAAVLQAQGMTVDLAVDGAEAVEAYASALAAGARYDLVLLDLTVPGGLGGVGALAELRRLDPGVRAVVSSGYSDDPVLADYRAHGFVGRVVKPFTADELERAVQAALAGR